MQVKIKNQKKSNTNIVLKRKKTLKLGKLVNKK